MKKLAISIVTYNRSKHIKEGLAAIARPTREQGIDIYIFDGSTDNRTEHVVEQYIAKGYDHIHYYHGDKQLSALEDMIQRITNAFLMPEAEYVWFCGDKFTVRPEHYLDIFSYIEKSYDIITIYGKILNGTRTFNKASRFLDYAMVPITHWGSTIIKKEMIEPYDIQAETERIPTFGVQNIYLLAIADKDEFKGVVIDAKSRDRIVSRYNTPSSTVGAMWPGWVADWYRFIKLLPSAYDDVRENLYNRPDLQMGFFSLKELLRQRSEGQFDWKKYWESREYVKKVIVMPSVFVFCISLLPRCVARWLWTNYSYGKKVCSLIKKGGRLLNEKLRRIQSNL